VTVIRGGAANPPKKDFIKTKQHQVFNGGADCYYVWHFYSYDSIVRIQYIATLQGYPMGCMTGVALVSLKL